MATASVSNVVHMSHVIHVCSLTSHSPPTPSVLCETHIEHAVSLQLVLADPDPEGVFVALQRVLVSVAEAIHVKRPEDRQRVREQYLNRNQMKSEMM